MAARVVRAARGALPILEHIARSARALCDELINGTTNPPAVRRACAAARAATESYGMTGILLVILVPPSLAPDERSDVQARLLGELSAWAVPVVVRMWEDVAIDDVLVFPLPLDAEASNGIRRGMPPVGYVGDVLGLRGIPPTGVAQ